MQRVRFRFWAAAKSAAGTETLAVDGETIADALARADLGPEFDRVAKLSTILVDGRRVADLQAPLDRPVDAEVLPPFAGG
ncbi:MoaD/ThiS family protein [Naumannella halotolerans]|uniref:Molybdopterin converting factor small subunit n=1 Tax=Naumannella halotolerans TaxID=993414 RepID=A0A4R7IZ78_9ACTN|nr:MoaD/ThiS family protein [Naumannella halotolerans]TDT30014.1 hypothetical protein CLV29_3037 [Naumannella halotolerans]